MKKKQWILYLAVAALVAALAFWAHGRIHFQWSVFREQIRHVSWARIAVGVAAIWLGYALRSVRWAMLIRPQRKVGPFTLFGAQVIGFTAVALFGRVADLTRPYLTGRRARLSLSSQMAVYALERMFDLAATALIFSMALLFAPDRATLPHRQAFQHSAMVVLLLTLLLGGFAIAVRAVGEPVARYSGRAMGALSPRLGATVSAKILAFREGLAAIESLRDFLLTLAISLAMWALIVTAYVQTMHAFVLSPTLATMSLARVLVLMAAGMAGSILYLPVIGWFTQIAVLMAIMKGLFNVPSEPALGCAAMVLIVTFMSVIPLGLAWARFERVSLKRVSEESEQLAVQQAEPTATVREA